MPDVVLPNMGLVQFEVNGDVDTWGLGINNNSALIDSHNHAFGQGEMIPSAGININADVSWGSLYAPTDLHRITFASITAITDNAQNKSLFVNVADNELYWRTNLGNNVKLTAGNALNVSAFAGGIVGDYSAVGAAEAFDNSNKAYTFKDGAAHFARLDAGGVKLIEFGTSETVGVTLQAPAALAASYSITAPLAAPSSTQLIQMNSSGVLTATNDITQQIITSSVLTPSALSTGNNNNLTFATGNAFFVRVSATGAVAPVVTGIAGGANGRQLVLTNISAVSFDLTSTDAASSSANQFLLPAPNVTIAANHSVHLIYDGTSTKWRMLSRT